MSYLYVGTKPDLNLSNSEKVTEDLHTPTAFLYLGCWGCSYKTHHYNPAEENKIMYLRDALLLVV